jgi:hypothetical protein
MICSAGRTRVALLLALLMAPVLARVEAATAPRPANVVLIVLDGLRWQELFSGADPLLLDAGGEGIPGQADALRQRFWHDDLQQRRRLLFPFMWDVVAHAGQIFGNQPLGSIARVTNQFAFSYPGYNEMLAGHADARIDSNDFGPNPNRNVFEWLESRPGMRGRVAVFGSWHTFDDIFNSARNGLHVEAGAKRPPARALPARFTRSATRKLAGDAPDALVQQRLLDYVQQSRPRALFVGFGETDDWAHRGRYDLVLESAHRADGYIRELWETMQAMPQYRDSTTFIITCDHGRGSGPAQWRDHGAWRPGSEDIWVAVLGPETAPLGERRTVPAIRQSQVAATVAALLGADYRAAEPAAAAPLPVLAGD